MAGQVHLDARVSSEERVLSIDVVNKTRDAITIVAHPRYLIIELHDARHEFVGCVTHDGADALPEAADYHTIAAGETERDAFRLLVERTSTGWTIGGRTFDPVPMKTRLRASYKADPVLPNVPSGKQRSLFRGPAASSTIGLSLP